MPDVERVLRKNVCTHCSVGCTVVAEVQNGVWVQQEPGWESPISQGAHCAKGASVRELTKGERRGKYPRKPGNGQWQRISWDQATAGLRNPPLGTRPPVRPRPVVCLGSPAISHDGP